MALSADGDGLRQVLDAIIQLAEAATVTAGFNDRRELASKTVLAKCARAKSTEPIPKSNECHKEKSAGEFSQVAILETDCCPDSSKDPKQIHSTLSPKRLCEDSSENQHKGPTDENNVSASELRTHPEENSVIALGENGTNHKVVVNGEHHDGTKNQHQSNSHLQCAQTSDNDQMTNVTLLDSENLGVETEMSPYRQRDPRVVVQPFFGGLVEEAEHFLTNPTYASVYDTFVKYDIEVQELKKELAAAQKKISELELLLAKSSKVEESMEIKQELNTSVPVLVTTSSQTVGRMGKTKTMKLLVSSDDEGGISKQEPLVKSPPKKKRRVKKTPKKRVQVAEEQDQEYIPSEYQIPNRPLSDNSDHNEATLDMQVDIVMDIKNEAGQYDDSVNSSRVYSCFSCDATFDKPKELKEHLSVHSGVDLVQLHPCSFCSKSYLSRKGMLRHEKRTHGSEHNPAELSTKSLSKKLHKCFTCGRVYTTKKSLRKHNRLVHQNDAEPKPYPCDQCSRSFNKQDHLDSHQRWHNSGQQARQCATCKLSFAKIVELKRHMVTAHGERPYKCGQCDTSYTEVKQLARHKMTKHMERSFICDVCGKGFYRLARLNAHQRSHSGIRPFVCDVCNRAFTDIKYLLHHHRTHTGEKPFCCDICGKMFAVSITLMQHRRTHTGEKPYKCDECDLCFTTSSNLNRHKRRHTGLKPFACPICSKAFSRSCDVTRHQITHTGVKPFRCEVCHICFGRRSHLQRHQRKHDSTSKRLAPSVPNLNDPHPAHLQPPLPPQLPPPEETHQMPPVSQVLHHITPLPAMTNYEAIIQPMTMPMQPLMPDNTRPHNYYI